MDIDSAFTEYLLKIKNNMGNVWALFQLQMCVYYS
jgi:hypothetical protein